MSTIGLEHHQSSENGVRPGYFKDWDKRVGDRDLLPHEYTHSWNGKFRRPADLWTPNFEIPMRDSLLWVYEGQTEYWGLVLAARSGLVTPAQARDGLANVAANFDARSGRAWRSLQDTTNEPVIAARLGSKDWSDYQRSYDYYNESALIWLDADTLIREQSGGQRSLDDFARAFFGTAPGRIEPLLYDFDAVVAALDAVQPHDWRTFLRTRLDRTGPGAPLDGLARAGWKLAWAEVPSEFAGDDGGDAHTDDWSYSLGIRLKGDGTVDQVHWGSPAFEAGLSRSSHLVAVAGVAYKPERLSDAVTANKAGQAPIELLVREGELFRTLRIDYRGGLRYPRLERIEGTPERLDAGILAARP